MWIVFISIVGSNLEYLWQLAPGLLLLALLLSGFAVLSLALRARKIVKGRNTPTKLKHTLTDIPVMGRTAQIAQKSSKVILILCIGFLGGLAWQDHEFNANRHTYADVLVVARHDDKNFTIQPARMTPWNATTCDATDWQPGQKMRLLTYQQRTGCKDVGVRGAYEFYTDHGKRMIFNQEVANVRY